MTGIGESGVGRREQGDLLMMVVEPPGGAFGRARQRRGGCSVDELKARLEDTEGVSEVSVAMAGRGLHVRHDVARVDVAALRDVAEGSGCAIRMIGL